MKSSNSMVVRSGRSARLRILRYRAYLLLRMVGPTGGKSARRSPIDSSGAIAVANADDGKILYRGRPFGQLTNTSRWGVVGDKKKMLAVSVDDGNLWRFDLDSGILLDKRSWFNPGALLQAPTSGLVAIRRQGTLAIIDADLKRNHWELPGPKAGIGDTDWSPNGVYLAAAGKAEGIFIWHAARGELERTIEDGACIKSLAWSPDGRRLALLDVQRSIRIYDSKTWKLVRTMRHIPRKTETD